MNSELYSKIIADGLAQDFFPGVVVSVRTDDGKRYLGFGGLEDPNGDGSDGEVVGVKTTANSVFDIASLTKPLATSLVALKAHDAGALDFDKTLDYYLPGAKCSTYKPTIRQVMSHNAGFPPVTALQRFFPDPENVCREDAIKQIFSTLPDKRPGLGVVYSCTGFLLLGLVLETISGKRLSEMFHSEIAVPLGLLDGKNLFANIKTAQDAQNTALPPIATYIPNAELKSHCVPTEICKWRKRRIRGEVHDESSYCMGGDGGNAGLFANIAAVEKLFDVWRDGGGIIKEATVLEARQLATPGLPDRRGLGVMLHAFDTSDGPDWPLSSYGHSGFTGTYVWRCPSQKGKPGVSVISLANRVYRNRETTSEGMMHFRKTLHRAVAKDLLLNS